MHLLAFILACVAAAAFFLDWYVTGPHPRRFASVALGLFFLTLALIVQFVVTGDPVVHIGD